jgi:DNA-binding Lrp family transcriptional regulator
MDLVDIRIIELLVSSPLTTGRDIANTLDLSPVVVTRRLQNLRKKFGLRIKGRLNYSRLGLREHFLVENRSKLKLQSEYITFNLKSFGLTRAEIYSVLVPAWQRQNTINSFFKNLIRRKKRHKGEMGFRIWRVLEKRRNLSLLGYNLDRNLWEISWQGLIRWLRHQVKGGEISPHPDFRRFKSTKLMRDHFPIFQSLTTNYKTPIRDLAKNVRMSPSKVQALKEGILSKKYVIPFLYVDNRLFGLPYRMIVIGEDMSQNMVNSLIEWALALPKTETYVLSKINEDTPSGIAIIADLPTNQTPNFQDVILLTGIEETVSIFHVLKDSDLNSWKLDLDLYNFNEGRWKPIEEHFHLYNE